MHTRIFPITYLRTLWLQSDCTTPAHHHDPFSFSMSFWLIKFVSFLNFPGFSSVFHQEWLKFDMDQRQWNADFLTLRAVHAATQIRTHTHKCWRIVSLLLYALSADYTPNTHVFNVFVSILHMKRTICFLKLICFRIVIKILQIVAMAAEFCKIGEIVTQHLLTLTTPTQARKAPRTHIRIHTLTHRMSDASNASQTHFTHRKQNASYANAVHFLYFFNFCYF